MFMSSFGSRQRPQRSTLISQSSVALCTNTKVAGIKVCSVGFKPGDNQLAKDTPNARASPGRRDTANPPYPSLTHPRATSCAERSVGSLGRSRACVSGSRSCSRAAGHQWQVPPFMAHPPYLRRIPRPPAPPAPRPPCSHPALPPRGGSRYPVQPPASSAP